MSKYSSRESLIEKYGPSGPIGKNEKANLVLDGGVDEVGVEEDAEGRPQLRVVLQEHRRRLPHRLRHLEKGRDGLRTRGSGIEQEGKPLGHRTFLHSFK